jgi:hypothetical protein
MIDLEAASVKIVDIPCISIAGAELQECGGQAGKFVRRRCDVVKPGFAGRQSRKARGAEPTGPASIRSLTVSGFPPVSTRQEARASSNLKKPTAGSGLHQMKRQWGWQAWMMFEELRIDRRVHRLRRCGYKEM